MLGVVDWLMRVRVIVAVGLFLLVNLLIQVARKPAEIANFVGGGSARTPEQTWDAYSSSFEAHATNLLSPAFLAALAQAESAGNPWATPQWRVRFSVRLSKIYSPASSAVGLMQFTDGTFQSASDLCVHDGQVREAGPWHDPDSCWFNWTYTRLSADDSIEMASAHLTQHVERLLGDRAERLSQRNPQAVEDVAAMVHLCGAHAAKKQLKRGVRRVRNARCGSHPVRPYLRRIQKYRRTFSRLSQS